MTPDASQQQRTSPPTVKTAKAIRAPQLSERKALFNHRHYNLSKIIGNKPPVLKGHSSTANASSATKAPFTTTFSSAPKSPAAQQFSAQPASAAGAKNDRKRKANFRGNETPQKKLKYFPGGPGGGGRYVEI